MPTKKRKVAAKKTAPKATKRVKSVRSAKVKNVSIMETDYTAKVVGVILYVWNILVVYFIAINVLTLVEVKTDNTSATLVNYFITLVLILLAFTIFKTAREIINGTDDGYLAGIVVLLNMAIFGYNGLSWGVEINFVSWIFFAVSILGLIFLVPALGKYKQVESHALTTWAIILHIIFWFAIVVITPMLSIA